MYLQELQIRVTGKRIIWQNFDRIFLQESEKYKTVHYFPDDTIDAAARMMFNSVPMDTRKIW